MQVAGGVLLLSAVDYSLTVVRGIGYSSIMTKPSFFAKKPSRAADSEAAVSRTDRTVQTVRVRPSGVPLLSGVATFCLLLGAFAGPGHFVMEGPGPMFNVLGEHQGRQIIAVSQGAEREATQGQLNMTTVSVSGGPYTSMTGGEALSGWFGLDGRRYMVVPTEALYPRVSQDEANTASSAQMADSQTQAKVAAAHYLKIPVTETVSVLQVTENSPAQGVLKPEDRLVMVNGEQVKGVKHLVELMQGSEGQPVTVTVNREGTQQDFKLTPVKDEESGKWRVGIALKQGYEFPPDTDIKYNTEGVGGPSAGLMLTLGTIEKLGDKSLLSAGSLSGQNLIAGTGTIDAEGKVGAIGGLRYKIMAAAEKGAHIFLVPRDNCDDVAAMQAADAQAMRYRTEDGGSEQIRIVAVDNLDQAVLSLEKIRDEGEQAQGLPTCG